MISVEQVIMKTQIAGSRSSGKHEEQCPRGMARGQEADIHMCIKCELSTMK
jgi:hypothetical protein